MINNLEDSISFDNIKMCKKWTKQKKEKEKHKIRVSILRYRTEHKYWFRE